MQHTSLRNRLDVLEVALGGRGTRIVIVGGLPDDYRPPVPAPESTALAPADRTPDPSPNRD
jgi:hypothetical protein